MPGVLKSTTSTYEFSVEELTRLIAVDMGTTTDKIDVRFVIEEVGADPMDRFPGHKEVTKISVTLKH
jgi:hypothetical protein